jgi:DNA-binding response OmpR family regulator
VDDHSLRSYQGGTALRHPSGNQDGAALRDSSGNQGATALRDPSANGFALVHGNLEIRPDEIQALVDGRRVGLTVREFQVLLVLARREDRVMRRGDIYSQVWGGEMKHRDRSVDVFVRKVRTKLAHAAPGWAYIHTHFGVGYRFAATPPGNGNSPPAPAPAGAPSVEPAGA